MRKEKRTASLAEPKLGEGVFIDVSAIVTGDVAIGDQSSVWPHAVLRADINKIVIGKCTNIQDLSILHVDRDAPCVIGDYVTAGHNVCLHGCTIGNETLIGIGSVVLSGARIENRVVLGAQSLVPEGRVLESGFLYFGSPAKKIRELTPAEIEYNLFWAQRYAELAAKHLEGAYGRIGLMT